MWYELGLEESRVAGDEGCASLAKVRVGRMRFVRMRLVNMRSVGIRLLRTGLVTNDRLFRNERPE